eukprot:3722607-Rhodomonas_salina.1
MRRIGGSAEEDSRSSRRGCPGRVGVGPAQTAARAGVCCSRCLHVGPPPPKKKTHSDAKSLQPWYHLYGDRGVEPFDLARAERSTARLRHASGGRSGTAYVGTGT